jgi:hypothetical protein
MTPPDTSEADSHSAHPHHPVHAYHATTISTDAAKAIGDMTVIAFYYLLRPGEYTGTTTDDAAFRLQDLQLFIGDRFVDP